MSAIFTLKVPACFIQINPDYYDSIQVKEVESGKNFKT